MPHNYTLRDDAGGRLIDGVSMDRLLDKVDALDEWPDAEHYRVTDHDGATVRNDLNPDRDADHHVDVADIDDVFGPRSFDTVVFDPPFDQSQAEEHYDGMHDRQRGPARRKLRELVRPGGVFVELGWNDHGPALQSEEWFRLEMHHYRRGPSYQPVFLTIDERHSRQETIPDAVDDE